MKKDSLPSYKSDFCEGAVGRVDPKHAILKSADDCKSQVYREDSRSFFCCIFSWENVRRQSSPHGPSRQVNKELLVLCYIHVKTVYEGNYYLLKVHI